MKGIFAVQNRIKNNLCESLSNINFKNQNHCIIRCPPEKININKLQYSLSINDAEINS